ncbi:hypothetical protein V6N12_002678 [Hibiscus sabdariffa]|uniref:Uncharacterized protein n=1 Tax=Hibiscus sabdariffa TaxID=183260 RepID=A0ABR2ED82_9ROSI
MGVVLKQYQVDDIQNLPGKKHGICRGRAGEPATADWSRFRHISCQCRFSRQDNRFSRPGGDFPLRQQISHLLRQAWTRNTKRSAIGSSYFSEYSCTESVSIRDREAYQIFIPSSCTKKMTWSASKIF